jgi:hypothetical protein
LVGDCSAIFVTVRVGVLVAAGSSVPAGVRVGKAVRVGSGVAGVAVIPVDNPPVLPTTLHAFATIKENSKKDAASQIRL